MFVVAAVKNGRNGQPQYIQKTRRHTGNHRGNYSQFDAATMTNGKNRQGQPQTIQIRRESTSATQRTALEHPFRSATANVKDGRNWLDLFRGRCKSIVKRCRRHCVCLFYNIHQ